MRLTDKDIQIIVGYASGLTVKEISFQLGISDNTVYYHVGSIKQKLNAPGNVNFAVFITHYAIKNKLVQASTINLGNINLGELKPDDSRRADESSYKPRFSMDYTSESRDERRRLFYILDEQRLRANFNLASASCRG